MAEARNAHRLRLPRRPAWDESTTPDQLEAQERGAFVEWRRGLATLEEDEGLVLTPFEKNLEVGGGLLLAERLMQRVEYI